MWSLMMVIVVIARYMTAIVVVKTKWELPPSYDLWMFTLWKL